MNESEIKVEGIEVEKKWKLDKQTVCKYLRRAEHALAVIGGVTLLAIMTGKVRPIVGVSFKVN